MGGGLYLHIYVILTLLLLLRNKEILDLLIGGKTNVLSNQLRSSGFLSQLGGHLGMACAWRARIDAAGTNFDLYVAE